MAALGVSNPVPSVKVGDSAELYAALRIDGQPVSPDQISQVQFIVQTPVTSTKTTSMGIIQNDGQGFLRWTDTSEVGVYLVQAHFQLITGETRSTMLKFSVVDPFADEPIPSAIEQITQGVWIRLEDLFDSIEGGPWLRDKTLYNFDENKIAAFISEALMIINTEMPPTALTIETFTQDTNVIGDNPNMPLLIQGTLVVVMKHLSRSYIEQPNLQGAQVVWQDRTRYSQMWAQAYQLEQADFLRHLILFKRTLLGLGQSALLVASKAGRVYPYSGSNFRAQGAYGRGFY